MHMRSVRLCSILLGMFAFSKASLAEKISFEAYTGPSLFSSGQQTLTIPTSTGFVQVSGGTILSGEANLPADQSSVYASAQYGNFIVGYSNPITFTFSQPINNFFLDVYNGNTDNMNYTVADNQGHSATFNLADNFSGGQSLIGFAATGQTITVSAGASTTGIAWDFSVDNAGFNEALPPNVAPEPASFGVVGVGLISGALLMRKRIGIQQEK